eukprot:scaffold82306_cov41-Phaeocystis_antarctica.AAC.2
MVRVRVGVGEELVDEPHELRARVADGGLAPVEDEQRAPEGGGIREEVLLAIGGALVPAEVRHHLAVVARRDVERLAEGWVRARAGVRGRGRARVRVRVRVRVEG